MFLSLRKKEKTFKKEYEENLIKTIKETEQKLIETKNNYNLAEDSDEIEYYIYEIKALEAKYKMLLKEAKKLKVQNKIVKIEEN